MKSRRSGGPTTRARAVRGRLAGGLVGLVAAATVAIVLAGCAGGPLLANDPVDRPSPPPTPVPPVAAVDPQPVVFPRDDGPHDRLTEWWYYTGHLRDRATDEHFGFEYVVFRAERGDFPVTWASHLAITDESGGRFLYGQRSEVGRQVDVSPIGDVDPIGFSFDLRGLDPTRPETYANPSWTMSGTAGEDRLVATLAPGEAAEAGAGTIRCDQDPSGHDSTGRGQRHMLGVRREPLDRAAPPDLSAALAGALRQRRRQRGTPDTEPRRGESALGARAVFLDVADAMERGAVGGGDPVTHAQGLEHAHARGHETFAARLVRGAAAPLEQDGREANA